VRLNDNNYRHIVANETKTIGSMFWQRTSSSPASGSVQTNPGKLSRTSCSVFHVVVYVCSSGGVRVQSAPETGVFRGSGQVIEDHIVVCVASLLS